MLKTKSLNIVIPYIWYEKIREDNMQSKTEQNEQTETDYYTQRLQYQRGRLRRGEEDKMKNCIVCNDEFEPNKYAPNHKCCDNLNCKKNMRNNTVKIYARNHKDLIKNLNIRWMKNNPEKVKLNSKKWREKNPNYSKEYKKKHKERLKEQNRIYWDKNKERKKEYDKHYAEKNRDKIKIYGGEYYIRNKDEILNKNHRYYIKNKESILGHQKEYYKKNIDNIRKSNKRWVEKNQEKIKKYRKDYYLTNKDEIKIKNKEYVNLNNVKVKEQKRLWQEKNKYKIKDNSYKYYINNKDVIIKKVKEYQEKDKERWNKYKCNYMKKRRKDDMEFKLIGNLRNRLRLALIKYTKTGKIIKSKEYGIDYQSIIEHLKPFPENILEYHIDHKKPLCSFNFINEDGYTNLEEVKKACMPENHQLLLAIDNIKKSSEDRKWKNINY